MELNPETCSKEMIVGNDWQQSDNLLVSTVNELKLYLCLNFLGSIYLAT